MLRRSNGGLCDTIFYFKIFKRGLYITYNGRFTEKSGQIYLELLSSGFEENNAKSVKP